ncbi:MAG: C2H2-type zinc finger protein [Paenibacillus sp.]|nr:C2H2-type zinc finger protein [Paenibacillus sp.]
MNDLNEILFPHNDTINSKPVNTKSNEFNFVQVWEDIDGEYNEVSEFVEACKLIVSNNIIAAAIALNTQSDCSTNIIEQNSLAALIGDIVPAAAAVVAGYGESPHMNTPFLDPCVGTPFTPSSSSSSFTPHLAQFHNSPYYSPYAYNNNVGMTQQDDIQVSNYLKADVSWQTPIPADLFATVPISSDDVSPELLNTYDNFNGNPTQLLLDTSLPQVISNNNDDSDSLFPPLFSDEPTELSNTMDSNQHDIFTAEDFEASNFLEDCFNDSAFDMHAATNAVENNKPMKEEVQIKSKPNNKRKNKENNAPKTNKRFKASTPAEDNKDRKFECNICHATFNRRYNLGTHIKVHSPARVKDFGCHLCTKAFDRKHDLTRHIATVHNGERAYNCNLCTSAFSRKDALVRHGIQKHQAKP